MDGKRSGKYLNIHTGVKLNSKQEKGRKLLANKLKKYILLYGGSRSGKTFLACHFIRTRAWLYAGSKHLIARFSFANAKKTIWLQTLYPMLKLDEKEGACRINVSTGIAEYHNGSIIILGGLEPSRIDSVLAAEYGTIFITEANENKYLDIEQLFSRLNDISVNQNGDPIPLKFLLDLNPTIKTHWTNVLFRMGLDPITLEPRPNYHEFDHLHFKPEDNVENLAKGYVDSLKALSPSMKKRFYEGEYGAYEGLVYCPPFDEAVHVVDEFDIPADWEKGRAVDFGYTNPFVTLWGSYDKSNEVVYIYREYSDIKTTVRIHSGEIKRLTGKEKISWTVCDHDAEDMATLRENGISTLPANKEKDRGIDNVIDLLYYDDKKKPNVKIFRSCKGLISEIFAYRWREPATKIAVKDRETVKEDDHYLDSLRYMLMKFFPENIPPGYILDDKGKEKLKKVQDKQKKLEEKKPSPGFIIGKRRY